jgi:hypothetical protein
MPDDQLSDIWPAARARLLPELYDRSSDPPASIEEQSVARNRLFEAMVRLGQAMVTRTPLVVFIEEV